MLLYMGDLELWVSPEIQSENMWGFMRIWQARSLGHKYRLIYCWRLHSLLLTRAGWKSAQHLKAVWIFKGIAISGLLLSW